jgi:hypothetical protein
MPMLGAQGLWAGRDLSGLIRRILLRFTRGCGESILTWILLRLTRGCGESILTWILTVLHVCVITILRPRVINVTLRCSKPNARPFAAGLLVAFWSKNNIPITDWLPHSPYFSPVESIRFTSQSRRIGSGSTSMTMLLDSSRPLSPRYAKLATCLQTTYDRFFL